MPEWIAEQTIAAIRSDGERFNIEVRIGRPYAVDAHMWRCPVALDGLYSNLRDAPGDGSLQALCLAASLVRKLLMAFVEDGGSLHHPGTSDVFEIGLEPVS